MGYVFDFSAILAFLITPKHFVITVTICTHLTPLIDFFYNVQQAGDVTVVRESNGNIFSVKKRRKKMLPLICVCDQ